MESDKKVNGEMSMGLEQVDGVVSGEEIQAGAHEPEDQTRKQEHLYRVHEEQLLNIFPEPAWMRILNELDPEDQENCANASPYFWELLKKERVVFLVPKVIDIMALHFEQTDELCTVSTAEEDGDDAASWEPVVMAETLNPALNAEEWKKIVLTCRLVCSPWNKAVENCYQKPSMTGIGEFVDELDPRSKLVTLGNIKWTKEEFRIFRNQPVGLRQFVEQFNESHCSGIGAPPKNPFIGRHLDVFVWVNQTDYYSALTNMLEKYGKYIWYLKLRIGGSACANIVLYEKLGTWLSLVPNLKYFYIWRGYDICQPANSNVNEENSSERNPLPKLEKLQVLCVHNLETEIASELIGNNCHVTYLHLCNMELEQDTENSLELPNLQGFASMDSPSGSRMMENLGSGWKNLKTLSYKGVEDDTDTDDCSSDGGHSHSAVIIGAPEAFAIFQRNWAETLTDLNLEYPFDGFDGETVLEQSKTLRLNLTGVRRLSLLLADWVFFDFALPLKDSLEYLVVRFDEGEWPRLKNELNRRVESEQCIQMAGYEDRLDESNIWEIFGKLKTVKFGDFVNSDSSVAVVYFRNGENKGKFITSKKTE